MGNNMSSNEEPFRGVATRSRTISSKKEPETGAASRATSKRRAKSPVPNSKMKRGKCDDESNSMETSYSGSMTTRSFVKKQREDLNRMKNLISTKEGCKRNSEDLNKRSLEKISQIWKAVRDNFFCKICCKEFSDPIVAKCSHVLCSPCYDEMEIKKCPSCSSIFEDGTKVSAVESFAKSFTKMLTDSEAARGKIEKYPVCGSRPCSKDSLSVLEWKTKNYENYVTNLVNFDDIFKGKVLDCMSSNWSCSICTEILIKPTVTACSHIYCDHCITKWLHKNPSCPECRGDVGRMKMTLGIDALVENVLEAVSEEALSKRKVMIAEREAAPNPHVDASFSGSSRNNVSDPESDRFSLNFNFSFIPESDSFIQALLFLANGSDTANGERANEQQQRRIGGRQERNDNEDDDFFGQSRRNDDDNFDFDTDDDDA